MLDLPFLLFVAIDIAATLLWFRQEPEGPLPFRRFAFAQPALIVASVALLSRMLGVSHPGQGSEAYLFGVPVAIVAAIGGRFPFVLFARRLMEKSDDSRPFAGVLLAMGSSFGTCAGAVATGFCLAQLGRMLLFRGGCC